MRVLRTHITLTLTACMCLLVVGCIGGRKNPHPGVEILYELNNPNHPIIFKAVRGRGGITLVLITRPNHRFVARPIYRTTGGRLIMLSYANDVLDIGYIAPAELEEPKEFKITIDWIIRGLEGYRSSGVTSVTLSAAPKTDPVVLSARNTFD